MDGCHSIHTGQLAQQACLFPVPAYACVSLHTGLPTHMLPLPNLLCCTPCLVALLPVRPAMRSRPKKPPAPLLQPAFGSAQSSPAFGAFGATSTPAFGAAASTPAFGAAASTPSFGGFGAASTPAFGAASSSPAFGTPGSGAASPFGTPGSAFGAAPASTGFGTPAAAAASPGQPVSEFPFCFIAPGSRALRCWARAPVLAAQQHTHLGVVLQLPLRGVPGSGIRLCPIKVLSNTLTTACCVLCLPCRRLPVSAVCVQGSGSRVVPYQKFQDKEVGSGTTGNVQIFYNSITAMPQYAARSFEELRYEDYAAGVKNGSSAPPPAAAPVGFGAAAPGTSSAPTGFGFGAASSAASFGASSTGSVFGQASAASPFGASSSECMHCLAVWADSMRWSVQHRPPHASPTPCANRHRLAWWCSFY